MGIILLDEGLCAEAEDILKESLKSWHDLGNDDGMIRSLAGLIAAAAGRGDAERARLLYTAEPFQGQIRSVVLDGFSDLELNHVMDRVRGQLGDPPSGSLSTVPLREAVALALAEPT